MSQSEINNAVVLVIDRLGANMLGAYGSTWFETPNFNRLAARSLVFDQTMTQSTGLPEAYDGLLNRKPGRNLLTTIGESGISPVLLTDEPSLAELPWADDFDRVIPVEVRPINRVAPTNEQTELAHFFAQAVQALTQLENGSCLWLHSRGLSGAWDAPIALRNQLADSEDPDPPAFYQAPARVFDPGVDDPDELLGYQQVCAAQVTLIDDFLGVVLDLLETEIGQSTLFCVLSTRGYPLGEHGLVGDPAEDGFDSCHAESVHVPLMVCLPNQPEFEFFRSIRIGSLVQPNLIAGLLSDWFGSQDSFRQTIESMSHSLPEKQREAVFTICGESAAIQTHAWKLIRSSLKNELFAKPDDRGEVNDVSRRCAHVVQSLSGVLDQLTSSGSTEIPVGFELPDELAIRVD